MNTELKKGFEYAYDFFLRSLSQHDTDTLKETLENNIYSEFKEYLNNTIAWNEAKLTVENEDSEIQDIIPINFHFTAGSHIERDRNLREYITYLEEFENEYP